MTLLIPFEGIHFSRNGDLGNGILDKAIAMQAYAKQAKDSELIGYATEIRMRAERRCGELLIEMAESGERAKGGGDLRKESPPVILSSLGVSPMQSSRWQAIAKISEGAFESKVASCYSISRSWGTAGGDGCEWGTQGARKRGRP